MASKKKKTVLWIVPKWPFPCRDGARVATTNLLKGLAGNKVDVELVAIAGHEESCTVSDAVHQLGVSKAHVIRRDSLGAGPRRYIKAARFLVSDLSSWLSRKASS